LTPVFFLLFNSLEDTIVQISNFEGGLIFGGLTDCK
jgi:hypothetical protein